MKDYKILTKPEQIFGEYKKGTDFKNGIGKGNVFDYFVDSLFHLFHLMHQ